MELNLIFPHPQCLGSIFHVAALNFRTLSAGPAPTSPCPAQLLQSDLR